MREFTGWGERRLLIAEGTPNNVLYKLKVGDAAVRQIQANMREESCCGSNKGGGREKE